MGAGIGFLRSLGLPFVVQDSRMTMKDTDDAVFPLFLESGNGCFENPDLDLLEFGMPAQISNVDLAGIRWAIRSMKVENPAVVPVVPGFRR